MFMPPPGLPPGPIPLVGWAPLEPPIPQVVPLSPPPLLEAMLSGLGCVSQIPVCVSGGLGANENFMHFTLWFWDFIPFPRLDFWRISVCSITRGESRGDPRMGWCTLRYLDFDEIHLHGMVFFDMIMGASETKDPGNERIRIPAFQRISKLWKRKSLKRITAVQSWWEKRKNLGFSIKISTKSLILCSKAIKTPMVE